MLHFRRVAVIGQPVGVPRNRLTRVEDGVRVKIWGPEWMSERELSGGEWAQLRDLLQLDPVPDHNVIVGLDVTVELDVI